MAVALFGGTFNPVHNGHLKIASELAEFLSVAKVKMMPCAFPPHRQIAFESFGGVDDLGRRSQRAFLPGGWTAPDIADIGNFN